MCRDELSEREKRQLVPSGSLALDVIEYVELVVDNDYACLVNGPGSYLTCRRWAERRMEGGASPVAGMRAELLWLVAKRRILRRGGCSCLPAPERPGDRAVHADGALPGRRVEKLRLPSEDCRVR